MSSSEQFAKSGNRDLVPQGLDKICIKILFRYVLGIAGDRSDWCQKWFSTLSDISLKKEPRKKYIHIITVKNSQQTKIHFYKRQWMH